MRDAGSLYSSGSANVISGRVLRTKRQQHGAAYCASDSAINTALSPAGYRTFAESSGLAQEYHAVPVFGHLGGGSAVLEREWSDGLRRLTGSATGTFDSKIWSRSPASGYL